MSVQNIQQNMTELFYFKEIFHSFKKKIKRNFGFKNSFIFVQLHQIFSSAIYALLQGYWYTPYFMIDDLVIK